MEIGDPSLLARLPNIGLVDNGQIHFAQVFGISDAGKKKRHEICAAVDGNSVNVIEVVNGSNLSSFPVPPDLKFLCPPCSNRLKLKNGNFLRKTYCVSQRRGTSSLQCYSETTAKDFKDAQTSGSALEAGHGAVMLLQTSPDDTQVLVLQEDGTTVCATENATILTSRVQITASSESIKVLAAHWLSSAEASVSILKSRADVYTTLSREDSILIAVYQTQNSDAYNLGVWVFPSNKKIGLLEPIIDHKLPSKQTPASKGKVKFAFLQNGEQLELDTAHSKTVLDLTRVIPQTLSDHSYLAGTFAASLDLSNSLSFLVSNTTFQVYNVKYRSLLASLGNTNSGHKRKRDGLVGGGALQPLMYFPRLRRVIARKHHQLVSIDIQYSINRAENSKQHSLLIGNIGRGVSTDVARSPSKAPSIGVLEQPLNLASEWKSTVETLTNLVEQGAVEQFQQDFIAAVTHGEQTLPERASNVPDYKLDYLISTLFEVLEPKESSVEKHLHRIRLRLFSEKLISWCISQGLLTTQRVERGLSSRMSSGFKLETGAVALAFLHADDSLQLASDYIRQCPQLCPADLAATIRAIVRKLLLQNDNPSGILDTDHPFLHAGQEEDQAVIPVLSKGRDVLPSNFVPCLTSALSRFAKAGSTKMLLEIRSLLDRTDVLVLIQFLRQQLFRGGQTRFFQSTSYTSPPPSREEDSNDKTQLEALHSAHLSLNEIVLLLSSFVDSIGPIGVVGNAIEDDYIKTLIPDLYSEISSAGEGVEEAVYMHGILRETLRYVESVTRQADHLSSKLEGEPGVNSGAPGSIVTIVSETGGEQSSTAMQSALPVSLRVNDEIDKVKVRKGGGQVQNRTTREMGMLQDRLRPAYSFERLIL